MACEGTKRRHLLLSWGCTCSREKGGGGGGGGGGGVGGEQVIKNGGFLEREALPSL